MSDSIRSDSMDEFRPLSNACIKALTDKIESKRKFAAGEIEKMTVEFSMANNIAMVNRLIIVLGRKFCLSHNQNIRKGGLIGLAAVMVGFKNGTSAKPSPEMIEEAIRPVLTCLMDSDPRMRFHACESLFNVIKVAKGAILPHFQSIFDGLSKIVCDPDTGVRNGAEALDRLLKDIIVEQTELDLKDFIEKLDEYIYTKNPFTQMFIISWIRLLDSKLNMVNHLPHLLDGIFNCLYDTTEEIRASTLVLLSEFLHKLVNLSTETKLSSLMNTLLKHAKNEREDPVQYTAVSWLKQFIRLMDDQDLITFTPGILSAILPCLAIQTSENPLERSINMSQRYAPQSTNHGNICEIATIVNSSLQEHVATIIAERRNSVDTEPIINDLELILGVLTKELQRHEHPVIKLAALDWLKALKKAEPGMLLASVWQHKLFQALLKTLSDKSDAVVRHALRVISDVFCDEKDNEQLFIMNSLEENLTIAKDDEHQLSETSDKKRSQLRSPQSTLPKSPSSSSAKKVAISTGTGDSAIGIQAHHNAPNIFRFIQALYKTFRDDETVFEERATFIVLNLCGMIKACMVYRLFAEILKDERKDLKFAYNLVQKLNSILLTSQPLFNLRSRLANEDDPEMVALFQTIYMAWCHSPMAAFTLCLAANSFRPAHEIVCALAQSDIDTETLNQINSVVMLIESPALSPLRIKLLDISSNQYLISSLYGLLMILPQSEAYNKLSHRLDQVHKFMCAQPHFKTTSPGHGPTGKQTTSTISTPSNVRESKKYTGPTSLDAMVKHYHNIQALHAKMNKITEVED